tara:strand:+ start:477 stop:605 length:129 start_codon:yes stop_codon:yes gene_type:complete
MINLIILLSVKVVELTIDNSASFSASKSMFKLSAAGPFEEFN